ncbi:oxidoreductase [Paraflavisolibacter sp. H34]|uniref:WD40/YVTN/BNR-like repeat-containing protein n=1 Tax=Huijunlia imazamoxiresistens TaxID=3127457 RepID=UPI003019D324
MIRLLSLLCTLLAGTCGLCQKSLPSVKILTSGTAASLRGLSVVTNKIVWASGSNGTVGRSTDGGKTWKWQSVKGFEKCDFRDIEAFDSKTAIIMAIDTPAYLLKTTDGGGSWKVVYESHQPGMFLDALEFWNRESGIVIGDPVGGKMFVARTFDNGNTWMEIPDRYRPAADSGEAFFASSGTNVRPLDRDESVLVSGGLTSCIYIRDKKYGLPILQGSSTTGANSVAVWDNRKHRGGKRMMVVGGDFTRPQSDTLNCFFTTNRGKTWTAPLHPPRGYRSCVEYLSKNKVLTCGLSGVDFSADGGKTFFPLSSDGYHVCRKAKKGTAVFLAGGNGKVGKMEGR